MDLVDIKDEFKNSKLLLVVLGTLLIPVTHSVDSLLTGLYKIFGLSLKSLLIVSISFHAFIIVCLIGILYLTISSSKDKYRQFRISLSLKTFRSLGLILFFLVVVGLTMNLYINKYYDKTVDLSKVDIGGLTIFNLAYLTMTQTGLVLLRTVLLLTIYFTVVFRKG